MTYDEIKAAWNAQADDGNRWHSLSEYEKVEWAAIHAAAKAQREPLDEEAIERATGVKWGTPMFLAATGFVRATERAHGITQDVDDSECHNCSGTGEGMYDGQSCVVCRGKGFL